MWLLQNTRRVVLIVLITIFVSPLVVGVLNQYMREARLMAKSEVSSVSTEEELYKTICPDYRDASIFAKWTTYREDAWCEDYLDRLP